MKLHNYKFVSASIAPVAVALIVALPTPGLIAENRADNSPADSPKNSPVSADIQVFHGTLMSAYSYLTGDVEVRLKQTLEDERESTTSDSNNELTSEAIKQGGIRADGKKASETKWENFTPNQPSTHGQRLNRAHNETSPLGLVVESEGVLGIGGGTEFHLLIADPKNAKSRDAFARVVSFSQDGTLLKKSDGKLRSSDTATKPSDTNLKLEREKAVKRDVLDHDRFIRITGELVKRDGFKAILVHGISPASRFGENREVSKIDALVEAPGDTNE